MASGGRVHDRELLDALEALAPDKFSGVVWRVGFVSRDPLVGSTHGGRWHPAGAFEGLYTSLDRDGALAEVYFHLSRAPVFSSAEVRLFELRLDDTNVLRLDDLALLRSLGLENAAAGTLNYERSQAIGAAAHFLEHQGILVPSARWPCLNLVLFLDRLNLEGVIVDDGVEVNWPAWKEHTRKPDSNQ